MGIKEVVKFFLIILSINLAGELVAKNYNMPEYGLTLSPKKCLLLNQAEKCEMLVTINWKVKIQGDYCLYNNLSEFSIVCWEKTQQANKKLLLLFSKDLYFELRDKKTNQVIFTAPLKLYKKTSNLRRKRRNPWSFY